MSELELKTEEKPITMPRALLIVMIRSAIMTARIRELSRNLGNRVDGTDDEFDNKLIEQSLKIF